MKSKNWGLERASLGFVAVRDTREAYPAGKAALA